MAASPQRVQKTSFTFRSNVRKSQLELSRCGVLHALRSSPSTNREEHAFAWIANYDAGIDATLSHLECYGFPRDRGQFLPYSSKADWVNKYPHAFPYVHCDEDGQVTGFPHWSPQAQSALDIPPEIVHVASQPSTAEAIAGSGVPVGGAVRERAVAVTNTSSKKKGGAANNRLANTLLNNGERNQLHLEIYNYFSWLSDQVAELETSENGRRAVRKAELPAAGLRGLLIKLETTFKVIGQKKMAKALKLENGDDDDDEEEEEDDDNDGDTPKIPLLEQSLVRELTYRAAKEEEARRKARAKVKAEGHVPKKSTGESLDFDLMFHKLLAYREEHGHPNVPVKYAQDIQLGSWVSGLRTKKKAYDKDGDAMELDEEGWSLENNEGGDGADGGNATAASPGANYQKYLNPERIRRLESIGFAWSMAKPKAKPKSWDERLEELRQWREERGTFKVPRAESLGEWLHNQRTLYGKKDAKFMAVKAPRMEEIGYKFDVRESAAVSWDDRFQQLVEFRRENGTFEVPCPLAEEDDDAGGDGMGNSEEIMERYKFYKWVTRLHNEYRAYEKGTSSKLNAERVEKLKSIDFQFKGPKSRGRPSTSNVALVPKLSWEKRLQQLHSFKMDTGHLHIDHNYRHCSNLGGWAAEMSTLYKNWKAGSQHLSEDMIAKFNQLVALGFRFDVLPYYENNRSWEDHYEVLLRFKEENGGSARVPLKYKADLRLGKWVQTQRQQYKLLREGKKSKLTEDRVERLDDAGFEWDRGIANNPPICPISG